MRAKNDNTPATQCPSTQSPPTLPRALSFNLLENEMNNLYFSKNGQQEGPFSLESALALVKGGVYSKDDFAWYEGLEDWIYIHQIPELVIAIQQRENLPFRNTYTVSNSPKESTDYKKQETAEVKTPTKKEPTKTDSVIGGIVLFLITFFLLKSCLSSDSSTPQKENVHSARVKEGEALLEEMDRYNANPYRTQKERNDIEKRELKYINRAFGSD